MREKFKTILLFSLVLISVYMTQKLWIQLPNEVQNVFETKEVYSTSYLISDMIAPNKYLLNFNQRKHNIVYDDKYGIWENAKKSLKELLESKTNRIIEMSKAEYLQLQEERSIVFSFPEKINTYILAKAWGVKNPNNIADTLPNISDIYIYLGSGDPFFVISGDNKYISLRVSNENTSMLKEQLINVEESGEYDRYYPMNEIVETENDIYMPVETKNSLSVVYVSNEIATLNDEEKDNLAEKFFSRKIDYIRKIVEGNGSTIYVYNQKILKLNSNGNLEYFNTFEETVRDRNLYISLSTAADFINKIAKAERGMYLAKVEEIQSDANVGYKLIFKYRIRGIPVLLGNKEVGEYITMEVFNNHIKSYKYLARKEMNMSIKPIIDNRTMLTSYDVLDKNYPFLEKKYLAANNLTEDQAGDDIIKKVTSSIEDITLSYYDPSIRDKDERLVGVWTIRMSGKIYAFDAYTGTLVFER